MTLEKPSKVRKFNGLALLVAMFREFDPPTRARMHAKLTAISPVFAKLVDRCDFIYADLERLDGRSVQRLLTQVSEDDWIIAWKLTSDTLKQHIIENMPERKRIRFEELVKAAPKVPRIRVIRLQVRIADIARKMLMEGKLSLASRRRVSSP